MKYIICLLAINLAGCRLTSIITDHNFVAKEKNHFFAIKDVTIIPMSEANDVITNATVIIDSQKIISIDRTNTAIPSKAKIINGKGKFLIPGLIDMHVHVPTDGTQNAKFPTRVAAIFTNTQDVMTPFVVNGVTTIFQLITYVGHFGQRNEILRGDVIGPRMALAAVIKEGDQLGAANNPDAGRQAVQLAKADGYEFIKVYSQLNRESYKAVVDEARIQGMKVIGHIPNAFKGRIEEAFVPNFGMVAHAEEFGKQTEDFSYQDAQRFAKLSKKNGTWLSPTLIVISRIAEQTQTLDSIRNLQSLQYVHPLLQDKWLTANRNYIGTSEERVLHLKKMVEFNNQIVKAFKEAGVPIVAGTDAGGSGVIWGFSLHDELELLVKAGLTPQEALVSATRLSATWLGIADKIGTIESGKFADMVLLDANPLLDIKNTRKISGVFVNGTWLDKMHIDKMLNDLSKRNSDLKDKYKWSKREEY